MSWGPLRTGSAAPGALPAAPAVRASGLPQRWGGSKRFVVLETGFGTGERFLETWAQWRQDSQRCDHLYFLSHCAQPPSTDALAKALATQPHPALAALLLAAWPSATPDLHLLDFEAGRVHLMLAFGSTETVLRQWVAQVDAFFLTDVEAEAQPPARWGQRWSPLHRLAAPGASLVVCDPSPGLWEALRPIGFEPMQGSATEGMASLQVARFAPRHVATPPPGRRSVPARTVAVVGAGLAGAAAARALAEQGLKVVVLERQHPASGASGNAHGLYHPLMHAADSLHARWFRACAALAQAQHCAELEGPHAGLMRLEFGLSLPAMKGLLAAQGLPETFARALSAKEAAHFSGLALEHPAWWFRQAGAMSPRNKVLRDLATPGVTSLDAEVAQMTFDDAANQWRLLDSLGIERACADAVVLANAQHVIRLWPEATWPQELWRGQTSTLAQATSHGLPLPHLPISGMGYAAAWGDALFFGATNQLGDADPQVRLADHHENLARYAQLCGRPPALWQGLAPACEGRTGWRVAVPGRMPIVGPLPLPPSQALTGGRGDAPRLIARTKGLYVLSALASRGLTQAPLAARILAAWITGAPQPVATPLLDAVDVARFSLPAHRGREAQA